MKTKIILLMLLFLGTNVSIAQSEPFLGEIRLMPTNFAPRGWLKCEGQTLPINQNQALFSLLGTTYGGNGRTTFMLPDLRGRAVVGEGGPDYLLGNAGGNLTTTLDNTNIAHAHEQPIRVSNATATSQIPVDGSAIGVANMNINGQTYPVLGYNNSTPNIGVSQSSTLTTTAGTTTPQSISVIQPIIGLTYMIAVQGIYPSQN